MPAGPTDDHVIQLATWIGFFLPDRIDPEADARKMLASIGVGDFKNAAHVVQLRSVPSSEPTPDADPAIVPVIGSKIILKQIADGTIDPPEPVVGGPGYTKKVIINGVDVILRTEENPDGTLKRFELSSTDMNEGERAYLAKLLPEIAAGLAAGTPLNSFIEGHLQQEGDLLRVMRGGEIHYARTGLDWAMRELGLHYLGRKDLILGGIRLVASEEIEKPDTSHIPKRSLKRDHLSVAAENPTGTNGPG